MSQYAAPRFDWKGWTVGTLLAFLILCIAWLFMTGYLPVRTFDSDDWKATKDDWSQTRVEMIEHLTRSGTLDGLAEQQVFDLLGECRDTAYFNEWDCVYRLGDQRGFFRIDSEWLVIDFNQDGTVERYEVVSD